MALAEHIPIGSTLSCVTACLGEEFNGYVLSVHEPSKTVLIGSPGKKTGTFHVHLINLTQLQSLTIKETTDLSEYKFMKEQLLTTDVDQVTKRYQEAVKEARRRGLNVSPSAQKLFDKLYKMYPSCHWSKSDIVIPEARATIQAPYYPVNCLGEGQGVERIRKILEYSVEEDQ